MYYNIIHIPFLLGSTHLQLSTKKYFDRKEKKDDLYLEHMCIFLFKDLTDIHKKTQKTLSLSWYHILFWNKNRNKVWRLNKFMEQKYFKVNMFFIKKGKWSLWRSMGIPLLDIFLFLGIYKSCRFYCHQPG